MDMRITCGFTLFLLLLMGMIEAGSLLTMISQGKVFLVNPGDSLELSCEFETYDFNLFNNPVVWKKYQMHEESQINLMSNLYKVFVTSHRFSVSFTPNEPNYRLELTILNVRYEDSGNYTCEIRGPETKIMKSVTHALYVRAPVEEIYLSSTNNTIYTGQAVLKYNETDPGTLRCVSIGGYPRPELQIFLGPMDITDMFATKFVNKMTGERGMKMMTYTVEKVTHSFVAKPEYDDQPIKCVAVVSGRSHNHTAALVSVNFSPIVKCQDKTVPLGKRNVDLWCEVRSKPGADKLFWVLDENGTTMHEGESMDEYWTIVTAPGHREGDGIIHMQLFQRIAHKTSFRSYTLIAGNDIGMTRTTVELRELEKITKPPSYESIHGAATTRDPIRENRGYLLHAASAPRLSFHVATTLLCLTLVWSIS